MPTVDLGRVQMVHRGAYSPATTYVSLDIVTNNGATWLCRQTCTGVAPTEGAFWGQIGGTALTSLGITVPAAQINAAAQTLAQNTILGRASAGSGVAEALTPAQARSAIGLGAAAQSAVATTTEAAGGSGSGLMTAAQVAGRGNFIAASGGNQTEIGLGISTRLTATFTPTTSRGFFTATFFIANSGNFNEVVGRLEVFQAGNLIASYESATPAFASVNVAGFMNINVPTILLAVGVSATVALSLRKTLATGPIFPRNMLICGVQM